LLDIRWARLAQHDLAAVDDHYMLIDPAIALDIGERILAAARFLQETPLAGPMTGQGDRRKWRVRGTPFILFYRLADDHLRILRVLHSARDRHDL
jgi:toxin ParE1/3/4